MMGALAEFERSLIIERTQAGLAAAKVLCHFGCKKLGRRRKLDNRQIEHAKILLTNETGEAVASSLGVSRATLYRALANVK